MIHRYNGVMADINDKLYTAAQVRGIDYTAIHELGIAGYELMCRAGQAVVDTVGRHYPAAGHWLILCGPGNNGGDGYVVARLANEAGVRVTLCSLVDPGRLRGDAALAYADWQTADGETLEWPLPDDMSCDLALDALLGTGIDREVDGSFRQAIDYLNQLLCPTIAIDIPSGLNADTGCVMGCAVQAQVSVTFVGRKRGMYTADGPDFCGQISFDDLAIPALAASKHTGHAGTLLSPDYLAEVLRPRLRNSHKGSFGHVLAVGGIAGMSGAIRLCGEAALRSGAGRVTLATDPAHAGLVNLSRPELMVRGIDGDDELLALLNGDHVVAAGPGLGSTAWSESLLQACLATQAALVVDADGLNLLASQSRQKTFERDHWILTPHPAEAARLLACSVAEIQRDRVLAATTIAKRYGACVVLKGCGSIVADPSGAYAICSLGNPGMATAGSGDVLTGIIVALLGQGLSCFEAACAGVLAHAQAGDLAAENIGEMALIAGDIIDQLPRVWRSAAA
jgi:NAD(P)H-hydrate epimerase